jgi:dTMP kinase
MASARIIAIEGLDGAGKSTLAGALARGLTDEGLGVRVLREPGAVEVSERIRALLGDPTLEIGARAEALLYAAARAQLVEQLLRPLLSTVDVVVLDRFVLSSLAYQGVGRGLGIEPVRTLNAFATGGLAPDLTLLLAIPPARARARLRARGHAPDRLELEDERFFTTIGDAYEQLARAEPATVRLIDAEQGAAAVLAEALGAARALSPGRRH